jgi:hypothetical protein
VLRGGNGNDRLIGGPGPDELLGEAGSDVLLARDTAADLLDGGPGSDCGVRDGGLDRVSRVEAIRLSPGGC